MSYRLIKSWDNRKDTRRLRLPTVNGRTWTRRIQWLESIEPSQPIKLKMDDGDRYVEIGILPAFATAVWDRFKAGDSIADAVSLFGGKVQLSRKGNDNG